MSSPVVSNEMYVILGATGHTGSIVADFLLSTRQSLSDQYCHLIQVFLIVQIVLQQRVLGSLNESLKIRKGVADQRAGLSETKWNDDFVFA